MLSIQQVIKAIRKLPTNGDLATVLKYAAIAGDRGGRREEAPVTSSTLSTLQATTSSVAASSSSSQTQDPTTTTTTTSALPKQQQQTIVASSQQQIEAENSPNETQKTSRRSNKLAANAVSFFSHLNESGSHLETTATRISTTQDQKISTTTTPTTTTKQSAISASPKHFHSRSQQIQKFFQQQLHQFHTQHNQSLYAKQKQTQFSMSSLAAEPLSLKPEDLVSNGSDAKLNGNGMENSTSSSASSSSASSSSSAAAASSKPCLKSGGLGEILQFMELIGNLKHTKRTGWVLRDVNDCESISGHMYRMSMMTFLLDGTEGLNQIRCMELALVHDLAESLVGDITPFCGVSKEDKRAMEFKAMDDICKLIEPRGKRIMELFEEYEEGESAESKFVKDLDRLDMVMQAFEYEKRDDCLLKHQEFFDSTEGKFKHPFVQQLVNEIYEQRRNLAKAKGATPPPTIIVPNMDLPATSKNTNGHCAADELVHKSSSSSSS